MELKTPETVKEVVEIVYTWNAGMTLDVIIDSAKGDYIKDEGNFFHVHLAAKPLISNPEVMAGEEDLTIYKTTLASIISRKRTLRMPNAEEVREFQKTLAPMPKLVQ